MLNTRQFAKAVSLALLALAMSPLLAQSKLYRCGNNFSQTPCGSDAAVKPVPNPAVSVGGQATLGTQVCTLEILKSMASPPGFTATVVSAKRGPAETIKYADEALVTRTYDVTVAVHNPMGTMVGTQSMRCNLSEDEQRVLKTSRPAQH